MRKIISLLLSFLILLAVIPAALGTTSASTLDKEVQAMVDRGVMQGFPDGLRPNQDVTRGQFAAFLYRALDLPKAEGQVFTDVPKTLRLYEEINAAAKAELIFGHDGGKRYAPNDPITREQMAAIMNRAMERAGIGAKNTNISFVDTNKLRAESQAAIKNMAAYGITVGYPATNEFKPKQNASRAHAAAFIYRMLNVIENADEEKDKNNDLYTVATVKADGSRTTVKEYNSFAEASAELSGKVNAVIVHKGNIVKMDKGLVIANAAGSAETELLTDKGSVYGGIQKGQEMTYLDSDEKRIKVSVAGRELYVRHGDVKLLPEITVKERSYYLVEGKELYHFTYDHNEGKMNPKYRYGYASSKLQPNVKYYSEDGVNFYDANGQKVDSFHQYFNMLPYRTKTNYTAEELDAYIMSELKKREGTAKKYENASTKSKLIGIGKVLKEAEQNYKLNALMLLAHAIHESDYGMSEKAQKKNNLFGVNANDRDPNLADTYDSVKQSVEVLSRDHLNRKYILLGDGFNYANGSHLGSKYRGINVRYASDPDWGKKIAGHMLTFDLAMGGKDFVKNPNPYTLYEVVSKAGLNVRPDASVTKTQIYRYTPAHNLHYVVASVSSEQKPDYLWHKIVSDHIDYDFGYVAQGDSSGDYIRKLNIAK